MNVELMMLLRGRRYGSRSGWRCRKHAGTAKDSAKSGVELANESGPGLDAVNIKPKSGPNHTGGGYGR